MVWNQTKGVWLKDKEEENATTQCTDSTTDDITVEGGMPQKEDDDEKGDTPSNTTEDDIESGMPPKEDDAKEKGTSDDTIASPTLRVLTTNILPNRPAQEIARDKKRIYEICYGRESPKTEEEEETEEDEEETEEEEEIEVVVAEETQGEVEETEEAEAGEKKKKKKKKKGAGKKKKKKPKEPIRDTSGKIKRKKLKIKGRSRVVKKITKRGKDANTDLPTISEDDMELDRSEFIQDIEAQTVPQEEESPKPTKQDEELPKEKERVEKEEETDLVDKSDSAKSPFCGGYRCIIYMIILVVLGAGVGVVLTFLIFKPSEEVASPTIAPPLNRTTPSSQPTNSPTITASPTVTPVPTAAPTRPRFEFLSSLLAPISPEINTPSSHQETALIWMVSRDPSDWSLQTDSALIERYFMVLLYFATEGDLWTTNLEWLSELSVCDWYGVACNLDGFVSDLVLGKWTERNACILMYVTKFGFLKHFVSFSTKTTPQTATASLAPSPPSCFC
jgi:hypothetical protein